MREHHLEHQLKQHIQAMGGICWKVTSPGVAGVPDRICLKAGRVVFVELKTTGKRPRPIQTRRIRQLRDQGFTVLVIDSVDEIKGVCDALSAS